MPLVQIPHIEGEQPGVCLGCAAYRVLRVLASGDLSADDTANTLLIAAATVIASSELLPGQTIEGTLAKAADALRSYHRAASQPDLPSASTH